MTNTRQVQAPAHLTLTPEYSTPYNAIIRDDVVMGVSRYFIERWLPVLGTSAAALVNTLRQLDYRCQDDAIEISGAALAREAAMSRRHLYTCLDHPWIGAFVQQETGPRRRTESGKIIQAANRYRVRMDDPLTPADADHLLDVLADAADTPLEAAQRALEMPARDLWAPDPVQPAPRFAQPRALTALDVLNRAFPGHAATGDDRAALVQAAEDLHRHVTLVRSDGRAAKIIVPQYFRRRWWPHLGHDLAWAYLWLRGWVYDNPDEGARRDTCWIPALNNLLAVIGRPREWWRRNVENATERPGGWSPGDFFRQTDAQKGRDPAHPQWVARQFTVALDVPLAPEDRARHAELVRHWPESAAQSADAGSATSAHTGEQEVRHTETHRPPEGPPQADTPENGASGTSAHTGGGGVRHNGAQGSATPAHRQDSESEKPAPSKKTPEPTTSRKHPDPAPPDSGEPDLPAAAAKIGIEDISSEWLFDRLAEAFKHQPEIPLYRAAPPEMWLEQTWPEPVRRHSPAWQAAVDGAIAPRDLVALILAVWGDATVNHPPRYLSWLLQHWQARPHTAPVERWPAWTALADLPIGEWFEEGRRRWRELVSPARRALPFGMDDLPVAAADAPGVAGDPDGGAPGPAGLGDPVGKAGQTARQVWEAALRQLRAELDETNFTNWVEGARAVRYGAGVLTIQVSSDLGRDWLERLLKADIEAALAAQAGEPVAVQIESAQRVPLAPVLPG